MNLVHDFSVMYLPERNLPVNEQMITNHELKSRISFIQYMPKKLSFKYTLGNLSNRAVFNFLHNYVEKNLYVYFDNFYIVYKLVNDLKNKTIFHVVLLELIQDHFQQNSKDNFQNKQSSFLKDQNLVAVNWKDKCDVYAMSSVHGSEIVG